MRLGIILTPDVRSKAYLQKIIANGIHIDNIIFMNDNREEKTFTNDEQDISKRYGFNITEKVHTTLVRHKFQFKEFAFVDINHHL